MTGFVGDDELAALLRAVDVPVAAQRHGSASASLLTWIGAGRRPSSRERRRSLWRWHGARPGALVLYDPTDRSALTRALADALADPPSTVLADRPDELSPSRVGALLADRYTRLTRRTA